MASLNPNLASFWFKGGVPDPANFRKARYRVLYGGRASSKSWEFAGMVASIASQYKTRVLCVRRFQNKIKDSVYTLIGNQISNFGLSGFDIRASEIHHENGSEFVFYGIERNTDEIKSFEGADILWLEEAHNLTKEQWEILEPTIRKAGSEIWISFNPSYVRDFVYDKFITNTPDDCIVRLINYDENPFLSDTLLKVINSLKDEDNESYQHIYKGVPKETNENVVIQYKWLLSCIDAHKKLPQYEWKASTTLGYDIADDGDDKNALSAMVGSVITHLEEWSGGEDEMVKSGERVIAKAKELGANQIGYDEVGVGAGMGSIFNDKGWSHHYGFGAGKSPVFPDKLYKSDGELTNKQVFANLKAQAWWALSERAKNTYMAVEHGYDFEVDEMLSFDSGSIDPRMLKQAINELSTPLRDVDNSDRLKVESKKDLKKRDVSSPNLADCIVIASARSLLVRKSIFDYV